MRSDTATVRRVRLVVTLAVAGAAAVMLGVILMIVGTVMRSTSKHPAGHLVSLGLNVTAAGIAFGLAVLMLFSFRRARASGARTGGPRGATAGSERLRASADSGPAQAGRGIGGLLRRRQVLNPTTVYTPGGLLGMPREARAPEPTGTAGTSVAPGSPAGPGTAGPRPPAGGAGNRGARPRAQPAWPGGNPGSAYPPGRAYPAADAYPPGNPPGSGQVPRGQPIPPPPPQDRPRSRGPMPPQGQGGPGYPGAGTARHPGVPGSTMPRGRRPGPPEPPAPPRNRAPMAPGSYGPPGGSGSPPRPGSTARPAAATQPPAPPQPMAQPQPQPRPMGPPKPMAPPPAPPQRPAPPPYTPQRPAPPPPAAAPPPAAPSQPAGAGSADVYVYRDPDLAAEPEKEHDAAYWYDLPAAEEPAPVVRETRGPFEPLVSSSGQPPGEAPPASGPPASGTAPPGDQAGSPEERPGEHGEDPAGDRARKLEQIKDLYLTAEAIGERNVGRHFDELLAQQRALISEYFKQPADPAQPGTAGEQEGGSEPSQGAGVASEQPRAW